MVDWTCVSNGERGGNTKRDIKVHVGKRITGVGIKVMAVFQIREGSQVKNPRSLSF